MNLKYTTTLEDFPTTLTILCPCYKEIMEGDTEVFFPTEEWEYSLDTGEVGYDNVYTAILQHIVEWEDKYCDTFPYTVEEYLEEYKNMAIKQGILYNDDY